MRPAKKWSACVAEHKQHHSRHYSRIPFAARDSQHDCLCSCIRGTWKRIRAAFGRSSIGCRSLRVQHSAHTHTRIRQSFVSVSARRVFWQSTRVGRPRLCVCVCACVQHGSGNSDSGRSHRPHTALHNNRISCFWLAIAYGCVHFSPHIGTRASMFIPSFTVSICLWVNQLKRQREQKRNTHRAFEKRRWMHMCVCCTQFCTQFNILAVLGQCAGVSATAVVALASAIN